MVEYQLPKLTAWVRFPSPAPLIRRQDHTMQVYTTDVAQGCPEGDNNTSTEYALIAQLAERIHGKDEVTGPIPVEGSTLQDTL